MIRLTSEQLVEKILRELETNPELKRKLKSALYSDHYATKEDIKNILNELKHLRKDTNKRFEQLIKEMNKRFEGISRAIEKMGARFGTGLELFSQSFLFAVLQGKGFLAFSERDKLQWRRKLPDNDLITGHSQVEFDIFCEDPLLAVEVTGEIKSIEKIEKFVDKLNFLNQKYDKKPKGIIITYEIKPGISKTVHALISQHDIHLQMIGHPLDIDL